MWQYGHVDGVENTESELSGEDCTDKTEDMLWTVESNIYSPLAQRIILMF